MNLSLPADLSSLPFRSSTCDIKMKKGFLLLHQEALTWSPLTALVCKLDSAVITGIMLSEVSFFLEFSELALAPLFWEETTFSGTGVHCLASDVHLCCTFSVFSLN